MIIEKGYKTVSTDRGVKVNVDIRPLEEKYAVVPNPAATISAWVQLAVGTVIVFSTIPSLILQIWMYECGLIALGAVTYAILTLSRKFASKKDYLPAILAGETEDNR